MAKCKISIVARNVDLLGNRMSQYDRFDQNQPVNPPPAMQPNGQPQPQPPYSQPVYGLQYGQPPRPVRRKRRIHPVVLGCALAFIGVTSIVICVTLAVFVIAWNN